MKPENLRTVKQLSADYPAFKESSIRWHIHNAASNGLNEVGAIVRINGAVYIDKENFTDWLNRHIAKSA